MNVDEQGTQTQTLPVFLKVSQVAEVLKVSRTTVYKLMDGGQLPYHKVGNNRRVSEADFNAYLGRCSRRRDVTDASARG